MIKKEKEIEIKLKKEKILEMKLQKSKDKEIKLKLALEIKEKKELGEVKLKSLDVMQWGSHAR
jgi:hypothetical protein